MGPWLNVARVPPGLHHLNLVDAASRIPIPEFIKVASSHANPKPPTFSISHHANEYHHQLCGFSCGGGHTIHTTT